MRSLRHRLVLLLGLVVLAAALQINDVNPAMAQTQRINAWRVTSEPILDGSAPDWQSIVPVFLPTTAQQVTPPMGGGRVETVAVRAVHWEDRLYVMLEWSDPVPNYRSDRFEAFTDAAAIQFPAEAGSAVPAICMGQADGGVNIWQWRSDLAEALPELPDGAYVDLYPFIDDLYYTARQAGNPLSQVDRSAVMNLVAGGFGTLEAVDLGSLVGHGVYDDGEWKVVLSRPFKPVGDSQPEFDRETSVDVAIAVWDGEHRERNGIKSVSAFAELNVTSEKPPRLSVPAHGDWPAYRPPNSPLGMVFGFIALGQFVVFGVLLFLGRRGRELRVDDH
jgi:hypothetical protein